MPRRLDEIGAKGTAFPIVGDFTPRLLVQMPGKMNETPGRFEWVLETNEEGDTLLTHLRFVKGGSINGLVNKP